MSASRKEPLKATHRSTRAVWACVEGSWCAVAAARAAPAARGSTNSLEIAGNELFWPPLRRIGRLFRLRGDCERRLGPSASRVCYSVSADLAGAVTDRLPALSADQCLLIHSFRPPLSAKRLSPADCGLLSTAAQPSKQAREEVRHEEGQAGKQVGRHVRR